jgi:cold shock CspA family protein
MLGTVAVWNDHRGFGQIRLDADLGRAFFHHDDLAARSHREHVSAGRRVRFVIEATDRGGLRARRVEMTGDL